MNTTVLITGANGFLGQKLVDLISRDRRYKVIATSKGVNRNPNQENYKFKQLDILNQKEVEHLLTEIQPDVIIHTAALTNVESCEQQPELCQRMNVDSVTQLGTYAYKHGTYIIHLSTDFVFDGANGPYNEEAETNPLSAYGISKLASEQALLATDCNCAILRTILVYGIIADPLRSNLVLWAKEKLSAGESIKVVNDQYRMPTFVDDLAEACLLAIEKRATGLFHISGKEMMSIVQAVYAVADFWNLDKSLIQEISAADIGQADNRPKKTGFDLTKAEISLGFVPSAFLDSLKQIDKQFKKFRRIQAHRYKSKIV
ncbi:SDR family oxidoreductase [Sphingobacterium sp. SYP-B4668]|uniref:SDR family oxidoreductase n=1 Tax=Sphingobacterium sp. SYP-B4668 TaxID=2996035 RepID=UPI0022DDBE0E|nr:SDR family oxidoreductase [Sphingobacterium sp. SYP-B4668]